jgi:hypothetical protein
VNFPRLRAILTGLDSVHWRSRDSYGSILYASPPLHMPGPRPVKRETPLSDAEWGP